MKKLYLLLAVVAVAATSCQKDVGENIPSNEPMTEELCSPYAVSEEEALDRLNAELGILYYGETTRANDRRVRKIEPVRYDKLAPATRSTVADVENLLYIVEFEDGKGSAILGADKRVEGVFAVLDKGVITSEDFNNAANGVATDELNTYLAGLIADEAIEQMSRSIITPILPPIPDELRVTYVIRDTVANYQEPPILYTHWDQRGIYNDDCLNNIDEECDAGPLTIAMAQLLLAVEYPNLYTITIGNESFSRSILNEKRYNGNANATVDDEVARYVHCVGVNLGNNYLYEQYNESFDSASTFLNSYGWHMNEDITTATYDKVYDYVYTQKRPALISGSNTYAPSQIHYWLIDGVSHTSYYETLYTYEGNKLISIEHQGLQSWTKVHANFGKAGRSDGFYSWGIFNVSRELADDDVVSDVGDLPIAIGGNRNYSAELKILPYNL